VIFGTRERGGILRRKGYRPFSIVLDWYLFSVSAGGTTGSCAGAATAAGASHGARLSAITLAHGGEEGESTVGVHPFTLDTGYGIIGLAHRPQDIELALTIVTIIFVDRHSYHLLQRFFNYILPLFAHLVKVGGSAEPGSSP
jgi:hypothetical protein